MASKYNWNLLSEDEDDNGFVVIKNSLESSASSNHQKKYFSVFNFDSKLAKHASHATQHGSLSERRLLKRFKYPPPTQKEVMRMLNYINKNPLVESKSQPGERGNPVRDVMYHHDAPGSMLQEELVERAWDLSCRRAGIPAHEMLPGEQSESAFAHARPVTLCSEQVSKTLAFDDSPQEGHIPMAIRDIPLATLRRLNTSCESKYKIPFSELFTLLCDTISQEFSVAINRAKLHDVLPKVKKNQSPPSQAQIQKKIMPYVISQVNSEFQNGLGVSLFELVRDLASEMAQTDLELASWLSTEQKSYEKVVGKILSLDIEGNEIKKQQNANRAEEREYYSKPNAKRETEVSLSDGHRKHAIKVASLDYIIKTMFRCGMWTLNDSLRCQKDNIGVENKKRYSRAEKNEACDEFFDCLTGVDEENEFLENESFSGNPYSITRPVSCAHRVTFDFEYRRLGRNFDTVFHFKVEVRQVI